VRAAGIVQPRELAIVQSSPRSIGSSVISEMRHPGGFSVGISKR